jgi:hypothetical protein
LPFHLETAIAEGDGCHSAVGVDGAERQPTAVDAEAVGLAFDDDEIVARRLIGERQVTTPVGDADGAQTVVAQ